MKQIAGMGFELPLAPKLKDFEAFISHEAPGDASRNDYSGYSDEDLVLELVATESPARELVFKLIDQPGRDSLKVYEQAVRITRNPSASVLQMLHHRGATRQELRSLVRTRIRLNGIYAELRTRFERLPMARAIYRAVVNRPESWTELLQVLRVEKIRTYREKKESSEDLKADAVEAAWHRFDDLYGKAADDLGMPEQVVLHPSPSNARLDWVQMRETEVKASLALFLPLLRGDAERLREPARQSLREHFRKWRAAKRSAPEVSLFEEGLRVEVPGPEEITASRLNGISLMKIAENRWGEKGRAFFQGLQEGMNTTEAAKFAGISRPTAYKYLRELPFPRGS